MIEGFTGKMGAIEVFATAVVELGTIVLHRGALYVHPDDYAQGADDPRHFGRLRLLGFADTRATAAAIWREFTGWLRREGFADDADAIDACVDGPPRGAAVDWTTARVAKPERFADEIDRVQTMIERHLLDRGVRFP